MKMREWLYHIPGSKLVPLQFLGKWVGHNANRYYDNASITIGDPAALAQLQRDVHNTSLLRYTMYIIHIHCILYNAVTQ